MSGSTVHQYEILEQLGGGGMGIVYKARDTKLDRLVALKFLPKELSEDEEANARFIQEARAASALDHPNICTIHDIRETEDGRLYTVMAFYDGQTLKYQLEDGPLEPYKATEVTIQIARGLAAAHEAGIVHRDIKPANIMVTDRGLVKILDFGIAKLASGLDLTKTGGTVGTVYYMSPEQIRGEEVDQRTDLWSLGVVLYQMLTSQRPFDGEYEQAVTYAILNNEPQGLRLTVPEPPLSRIVQSLLEKDPEKRYRHATDVLSELGDEFPLAQPGRSRVTRPTPRRLVVGLLCATLLAVILVYVQKQFYGSPAEAVSEQIALSADKTIAVMPFRVRGGEELEYLSESMVDLLSVGIQGAGDLQTVDPNSILGSLGVDNSGIRDPIKGLEIASAFGAGRFVLGNVTQLGPEIRVNVSLYDAAGMLQQWAEARASSEEHLAALVDTLVVQLIAGQVAEPLQEFVPLASQMTGSFPALKAYLRGELNYRQGRFNEGRTAFREAIKLDSTFALAMDRLRDWAMPEDHEIWERLQLHKDKLPERERTFLEAELRTTGSFFEWIRQLEEVMTRYPFYSRGWFMLGDRIYHNGYQNGLLTSESRPYLERAFELDPNNGEVLGHLRALAAQDRDFDYLESLLTRKPTEGDEYLANRTLVAVWRQDQPALDSLLVQLKTTHWGAGFASIRTVKHLQDVPSAVRILQIWRETPRESDRIWIEALAEGAGGRFDRSDSLMMRWIEEKPSRIISAVPISFCLVCPVRREHMLDLQENVDHFDTTRVATALHGLEYPEVKAYLNGLVAFRLEDWESFTRARGELSDIVSKKGHGSLARTLVGVLEALTRWSNGDPSAALETLEEAGEGHDFEHRIQSPLYNHTLYRYLRAELLFVLTRFDDALPWYASLNQANDAFWSLPFIGPSLLRQAEIYEQLGEPEKAADFYRRFLKLWTDADPEVQPLVEQARESLDRLIEIGVREPQPS